MYFKLLPLLATLLLLVGHTAATFLAATKECQQEVKSRDLRPCMQFLRDQERRPYGPDPSLSGRGSRPFYRCCDQLKLIQEYQCRCQGLRMHMRKVGRQARHEILGMLGTAEILPRMCGIGPDICRFDDHQSSSWFLRRFMISS